MRIELMQQVIDRYESELRNRAIVTVQGNRIRVTHIS
jgi:hypothetical protein